MSLKARVRALEKQRGSEPGPGEKMSRERALELLGGGVYEARWIRDLYGIDDPGSDEIDRQFGGIEQLNHPVTTFGNEPGRKETIDVEP